MIVTYVFADKPKEWNTSNWRCVMPARAINRTGRHEAHLLPIIDFEKNTADAQNLCGKSDVIVVERNFWGSTLNAIMFWKARGKVMIANFDDAYQFIHPSNVSYQFWTEGLTTYMDTDGVEKTGYMTPRPLTQFKWGLRLCHGITSPSKVLANDWKDFSPSYFLPNYFEVSHYLKAGAKPHEGILIGWGGSLSHFQSFTDSGVLLALRHVCQARKDVRVLICGDQRVFDKIKIPDDQKLFQPFASYEQWPNVVARYDIGLAPLQGEYDRRRSWIKPMEYMLLKIPWIASEGSAYEDLAPYGKCVRNTVNSWEKAMMEMVDNVEDARKEAAGEPFQYAMNQDINLRVGDMLQIYADIARKAAGIELKV